MTYIMVDIEADGPIPGDYSMVSLGAVAVDRPLDKSFYREIKPISEQYDEGALGIAGFSREKTLTFPDPLTVMTEFKDWIEKVSDGSPLFVSDNNGFDWMFVCWYFHHFLQENPFGHSSMNLGSFYKGVERDVKANFRHLRNTKHTHNALDDALGNAEAMVKILNELGS
jgi:DNA polymerase III epsilon subunit-like protein